jgi:hypothetical protein
MKKFLIAEAEKARILGMHYKAMGKSLVNEQDYKPEEFQKAGIQQLSSVDAEDAADGRYSVAFTENTNGRRYYYMCATNPEFGNEPWNKAGAIYDGNYKIANDPFVLSQSPEFKKMMAQECKPVFNYIAQQQAKNAPQPQVAAATTDKVTAPNPVSDQSVADAQKRSEAGKANTAQMKVELTTKLADPNFLNPNKYDTDKSGLDSDAQRASLLSSMQGVATGDEAMALKRKINTLIKAKPEYKAEPFGLNINF